MSITLAFGLISLLFLPPQPVDFPTDLDHWYVTEPPSRYNELVAANNDIAHTWAVSIGERGPRATLRHPWREIPTPLPFETDPELSGGSRGTRTSIKVEDGWIVGFNTGEFGAALWWFSPDGKARYKISKHWVVNLVPTTAGLLVVEGLAHGFASDGSIVRLSRDATGRWRTDPFCKLDHAPYATAKAADGSLVIVTSKQLIRVNPSSKKIDIIADDMFWGTLYPNSIVIAPSGAIYIGTRHGVAKIEKLAKNAKISWLQPSKAFADATKIPE
jgi:hypothetical protein